MIKAPFNFVPLSEKVYFPNWADQISHDIPFEDGEDGVIELSITNITPLFTKNGAKRDEKEEYSSHITMSDGTKRYFIPGTSIKGCLRSVMEILSFAKMQQYNDDSFGMVRDFDSKKTDNKAYTSYMKEGNVFCGWLKQTDFGYLMEECAEGIQKVSCKDLKKQFTTFNYKNFKIGDTAEKKQRSLSDENAFDYPIYEVEGIRYKVVCTGFMAEKEHEYLFSENKKTPINVDESIIKAFESVHKNTAFYGGKNGKGGFLKQRLHKGESIPVFFTKKDGKVEAIGITRMFRYPMSLTTAKAVANTLGHDIDFNKVDLPEAIFGYIRQNGMTLKGRVVISHAICDDIIPDTSLQEESGVLGQPSASYYPLYLKQEHAPYKTYENLKAEIAGRKRYRIGKGDKYNKLTSPNDNEKVKNTIKLIPSGHTFRCSIVVHNMRPMEIGALISAITFNNTPNTYHNLGMAKNHGFGKVKCDIELKGFQKSKSDYMKAFETMLAEADISLAASESVNKLIAIATDNHEVEEMKFMDLKQYRELKRNSNFSTLTEVPTTVSAKIRPQDVKLLQIEMQHLREAEAERKRNEKEALLRKDRELERATDIISKAKENIDSHLYPEAISFLQESLSIYTKYNIDATNVKTLIEQCKAAIATKNSSLNLDQKNTFGEYAVSKFNQLENKINNWKKKNKAEIIDSSFFNEIITCIQRLLETTDKKERKEWDNPNSKRWDVIRSWIGDAADKLT